LTELEDVSDSESVPCGEQAGAPAVSRNLGPGAVDLRAGCSLFLLTPFSVT